VASWTVPVRFGNLDLPNIGSLPGNATSRAQKFLNWLDHNNIDVCMVQELETPMVTVILQHPSWVLVQSQPNVIKANGKQIGNAILFKRSKFILQQHVPLHWDVAGQPQGMNSSVLLLQHIDSKKQFAVWNVHNVAGNGQNAQDVRAVQLKYIVTYAQAFSRAGLSVVVAGNFNSQGVKNNFEGHGLVEYVHDGPDWMFTDRMSSPGAAQVLTGPKGDFSDHNGLAATGYVATTKTFAALPFNDPTSSTTPGQQVSVTKEFTVIHASQRFDTPPGLVRGDLEFYIDTYSPDIITMTEAGAMHDQIRAAGQAKNYRSVFYEGLNDPAMLVRGGIYDTSAGAVVLPEMEMPGPHKRIQCSIAWTVVNSTTRPGCSPLTSSRLPPPSRWSSSMALGVRRSACSPGT
jgi:hypothetical protein